MTKPIRNEIWVLADNRAGTASQAIGLAKEIGIPTKIITLKYSPLVALPNCFFGSSLRRLTKISRNEIESLSYLPSLVISAGRRSAPIALALKKIAPSAVKTIQIMNPNMSFKNFDLVVLPKHDAVDEARFTNVATTIGSLTKIDENLLLSEARKIFPQKNSAEKLRIALLVGGSSKSGEFDVNSAKNLIETSLSIAKNMKAQLLILNSRRTSEEITSAIKSRLGGDSQFFDWKEVKNSGGENNPYLGILGGADFFIITGDSVSMISEACSTGKPVYIFDEKKISSSKHQKFHEELFRENYARRLVDTVTTLENFPSNCLDETKRIASIVRAKFITG